VSHSSVLVVGEDPEKMLAPYDDNITVEPYRKYEKHEKPAEHWCFSSLDLAPDVDWPTFVAAFNEQGDGEDLLYDAEQDRVYEMTTYNPLSRHDWYVLGGRWTGYWRVRPRRAAGAVGEPGLMTAPADEGWVDQARKCDIDFEATRQHREMAAREQIRHVLSVLDGQLPLTPWSAYRDSRHDIEDARREYRAQPGPEGAAGGQHPHPLLPRRHVLPQLRRPRGHLRHEVRAGPDDPVRGPERRRVARGGPHELVRVRSRRTRRLAGPGLGTHRRRARRRPVQPLRRAHLRWPG
jgi:hypothetical protein